MDKEKILIVEDEFIVANDLKMFLDKNSYKVIGIAASVPEAKEIIEKTTVDLVLLDIMLKGKLTGIDLANDLRKENIPFIYLSANSNQTILEVAKATEPYGFLVKPYREKDVLVTLEISRYRYIHSQESKLKKLEAIKLQLNKVLEECAPLEQRLLSVFSILQSHVSFDFGNILYKENEHPRMQGFLRIGFNEYQRIGIHELSVISGAAQDKIESGLADFETERMSAIYDGAEQITMPVKSTFAKTFGLQSELSFPLYTKKGSLYSLSFFSKKPGYYNSDYISLLTQLQQSLLSLIDCDLPGQSINSPVSIAKSKDTKHASEFERIAGTSPLLLQALDLVTQVAPLNTSVLILGESGTGKERIADCIHNLSTRKGKPFIKVNCAALPQGLIESELFGHEKGAFTGAMDKKTGKFELANGGTIFLDEIGELPLDNQVKLLRVLQEREIERVGGRQPIKIDVRVIAATNRNLEKEIGEGRFRLDLYYRLNVFPITLPALRERKEDIALLANFFAKNFCGQMKKKFNGISQGMIADMEAYHWPGNVRELENIIEQSAILNDGQSQLSLKRPLHAATPQPFATDAIKSLDDIKHLQQYSERAYIISILKKAGGRIRGKGGAAELLNQKPTTLESRIARLNIRKEDIE